MGFAVIPCALGLVFVPPSAGHRLLRTGEHLIASQEGRLSTTVVGEGQTGERFLVSGGHRIASGRYAQVNDHVLRGHTPIDLSPAPKRVLLIGLGTGETAAAILKRPAVEHLRCVEIDGNQRDLLPFFGTQHILHHSNFDLVTDDGRHHLRMTDEKWDVITVDAYGPRTASAAFYSQQFYIEAKKHLLPDGLLFVKLDPLSMFSSSILGSYLTTFFDVFPHGSLVYIRRGFFGLVGRLKSPVSIDSNYVVAARGDTLPAQLGSPRRVTDDWPLRVPVVYQPNPDVLAPWWRAQHGDRPMPWAALRPQTKGGKTP